MARLVDRKNTLSGNEFDLINEDGIVGGKFSA